MPSITVVNPVKPDPVDRCNPAHLVNWILQAWHTCCLKLVHRNFQLWRIAVWDQCFGNFRAALYFLDLAQSLHSLSPLARCSILTTSQSCNCQATCCRATSSQATSVGLLLWGHLLSGNFLAGNFYWVTIIGQLLSDNFCQATFVRQLVWGTSVRQLLSGNIYRATFVRQPLLGNLCGATSVRQLLSGNIYRATFVRQPLLGNLCVATCVTQYLLGNFCHKICSGNFIFMMVLLAI